MCLKSPYRVTQVASSNPRHSRLRGEWEMSPTIQEIAKNATEAACVASEAVKTAEVTNATMSNQTDAKGAVKAIETISGVINKGNDISGTIATAVEEQSATTNEMSRNALEAAKGATEIASSITGVAQTARGTFSGAEESQKAAQQLARMS